MGGYGGLRGATGGYSYGGRYGGHGEASTGRLARSGKWYKVMGIVVMQEICRFF